MKAIAKLKPAGGFERINAPRPEVTSHRVLVQIRTASICGSDVHLYQWDDWAKAHLKPPRIVGHEGAGEVVEVGSQVKHLKVGDRVSLESHIPCLGCDRCRTGEMHLCRKLQTIGFEVDGCFAETIAMPELCCVKHPDTMPWEIASIQEPLGNAVYAVSESAVAGKSVAIFGDGPIGLFACALARCLGAVRIFAAGASPYRMAIMKKFHPDFLIDARPEPAAGFILEKTHGEGVDVVLEMSGAESAIHDAFRVVRNGGTVTAFGIPSKPIALDLAREIILKGIRIIAIHGRKMFDTWKEMGELLGSGRLDVTPVITHRFAFSEFASAFDLLTQKPIEAGKVILQP